MSNQLPDWLRPLEQVCRPFPRAAVETAVARRGEAIPHLLHALEWVEQHPEDANDREPPYMLHLFALYLLAQFRERRAFPLIVQLFRHPLYDALTGDVVSDDLPRMLAATWNGSLESIQSMIEDPGLDECVRAAALRTVGVLLHSSNFPRETASQYFGALFAGKLEREPGFVWDALVDVCTDFGMAEHLPAIRAAYADDLCGPDFDLLEDVEVEIQRPPGTAAQVDWKYYSLIDDAAAELEQWYCFDEAFADEGEEELALGMADKSEPIRREEPKIGRNDPCPCLSGKKYKKCCGAPI